MHASNRVIGAVFAAGFVFMLGTSQVCAQEKYPAKPIRVIIPTVAGGSVDILIRAVGQSFAERTGQPFIVESRPCANSIIAAET